MQEPDHNRMGPPQQPLKRRRGRPRKNPLPEDPPPLEQPQEVQPVIHADAILPIICPECGRGMTPRVEGKRPNNDRRCRCTLCGKTFEYVPPKVRTYKKS